jgi:hypothetical protein
MPRAIRRVVTGHTPDGRSTIVMLAADLPRRIGRNLTRPAVERFSFDRYESCKPFETHRDPSERR